MISALDIPDSDEVYYVTGVSVYIGFSMADCMVCLVMCLSLENKMRSAGKRDHLRQLRHDQQYQLGQK